MKYWLTACSSLPRKKCGRLTDCPAMMVAGQLGLKSSRPASQVSLGSIRPGVDSIVTFEKYKFGHEGIPGKVG